MATTVRDLMGTFSLQPLDINNSATITEKRWTREYPAFDDRFVTQWPPTVEAIETFLGPVAETRTGADYVGLETPAYPLNMSRQLVETEGDVTRDFNQNIICPVELAFGGTSAWSRPSPDSQPVPGAPKLWSRSLVGSSETGSSTKIIDFEMVMSHREPSLESAAMIGEMKKAMVIKRSQWRGEDPADANSSRLQQELRGYAYKYQCPQVFVFDSRTLVIVQFRATKADDIRLDDCPVDCCVIPRKPDLHTPGQCSMQYALYRLAWRGWVRLCATLEYSQDGQGVLRARRKLTLNGLTRKYEYWSGRPKWVDNHGYDYHSHPGGYERRFTYRPVTLPDGRVQSLGFWVWVLRDEIIDDTRDCFISRY